VGPDPALLRGREGCASGAWAEAYEALLLADRTVLLAAEDLELLALAAYMSGRDAEYLAALERAHHVHVSAGEARDAARCAFWLGLRLAFRGEMGPATGWFGRAQRLVEGETACVEHGWLLLPLAEQRLMGGELEAAYEEASRAAAVGEGFQDLDLTACARHLQGRIRVQAGGLGEGLALLDEAMVAVVAGELSPIVTGLIYCSVIEACQQVYAFSRAREWTEALTRWCKAQPQMVAFTGTCLVHRAEILQLIGDWDEAIEEARRGCIRLAQANNIAGAAAAHYREGEIHRLRGDFRHAEVAFRDASQLGLEPLPGYALLRLAQGQGEAATAGLSRALGMAPGRLERAALLPAMVEILLAAGDLNEADLACSELEDIAAAFSPGILSARSAQARGALLLAQGDARAALGSLRDACQAWQKIEAVYEGARTRELMGVACRALGDRDGGRLELEAALTLFRRLGAAPDVARVRQLVADEGEAARHGLTHRELQVLRLVAAGGTNKVIAAQLCRSEKTIDRHLSNIFAKLEVHSRAAATAWAYERGLI
jgi:DNA-binding CsgD family transcriptional regulator